MSDPTSSRRYRLTYQPALDGVRGVAVALVVIFHLDVGVFSGGYLGVSVFFTLSGFLITSLLVDEWRAARSTATIRASTSAGSTCVD